MRILVTSANGFVDRHLCAVLTARGHTVLPAGRPQHGGGGIGRALLVLEEPTQGVDVGAKAEIYATLASALTRETGLGIILVWRSLRADESCRSSHR